jgi:hypothetical protein
MSNDLWSIVTLIGLAGWILSMIVFLFRSFPARGVFEAQQARIWGAATVVSYAVWIVGMINA